MSVPRRFFDGIKVIDTDTHLTEPHDLWTARAPASYRDRVPQVKWVDGRRQWFVAGDVALAQLLDELEKMGGTRARLRASVFGGSAPPIAAESGHLGERNVQQAIGFLAAHAIPIQQRDLGGTGGRKVVFAPAAGTAAVVRLAG